LIQFRLRLHYLGFHSRHYVSHIGAELFASPISQGANRKNLPVRLHVEHATKPVLSQLGIF
jgi:hypothetical protein